MAKSWEEYKSYRINKKKEEEEEKKRQQQQQQKKESTQSTKNSNNVVTYNRTIKPSAIQQLTSNPNNIRVLNREESQKVVNPDSLWEKIKSFAGDAERIDQNIGEGISNGLKDLWSRVYRARQTEIKQRADMFSQTDTMLANSKNENARNNGNRLLEMNTKTSQKATENMKEFDAKRREEKEKSQRKIAENISKQNNIVTKKMAELAPSIGNMGVGMVASAINPIAGTAYFTGSAAGSYYYDALDRGMTEGQADRYGNIMGALEGITEMIGVKNIQKGGRVVKTLASGGGKTALKAATSETVKTGTKEALKNFGIGIADNFMQESIMEPLQELTAQTTGGKDKANWENMGKRMLQSGIDGALTSIIMSGADAGSNICIGLEEKIQNGKKLTQQDIQQGVKDAEKAGVDVKKVSEDNLLRERDKIINEIQSNKQEENISNQVINQESKTPQNRTSQVEAQAKAQTNSNLAKVRQFYDENTFNQMKQFIETAPSQEALNQINEDIKTETKNKLEEVYKSERFTESQSRKKTYAQYQRQNNTTGIQYNNDVVNNALDAVAANKNGRRTVGQWRQVAEQIGLEASNLSKAEIDNIAYGSWFDLQPTKNITRYDNRTKEHKGFERFTSDDWINTIYESAKGQKLQQLDTVLNQTVETTQEQNLVTPKDNSEVMNEVQDYIKNNNLDMTTDEFVEWASNVELENEENMTQEQKELYSLINDIQNRTSGMYNENMVDFDKNTYLDYKNSNNITQDNQKVDIETFSTDSYEGQTNLVKQITDKDGNVIAKLEYAYYDGQNHVQMIEVEPEYRRKGLAKKLLQDLQAETPDKQIMFGMTTPDGTKLIESVTEKIKNPVYNEKKAKRINKLEQQARDLRQQIEDYNNKLKSYAEKNKNGTITEEEMQEWRKLSHEQTELMQEEQDVNEKWYKLEQKTNANELREFNTFVKQDNKVPAQDNQGRQLSKQQQEFFKDSKVRDENGNLLTVYHGTEANAGIPKEYWFSIFDEAKQGNNGSWFGNGFYFTSNLEHAQEYAHSKGNIYETYLNITNPYIPYKSGNSMISFQEDFKNTFNEAKSIEGKLNGNQIQEILKNNGYDGIIIGDNIIAFYSNQIKNIDNKAPTDNPDIRYELEDHSDNTAQNEIQRKINRSMTMKEAEDMIQRAFVTGNIYDWYDGKYKNGNEWLQGEGAEDVSMWIENDYNLQNKYINSNEDILNEEYTIDDVIEAYQNNTLTGNEQKQTQRLDTSKDTGYKDDRFFAPKEVSGGKELYDLASQRVTNKNRNEVYKARADFIINAHNEGYVDSLGLSQKEVNEALRKWSAYPVKARNISGYINQGVATENKWVGIENSSIVNQMSISTDQLESLVKEVKGTSNEYQRKYIVDVMLALDTHLSYKGLTYDFAPNVEKMGERALADYSPETDTVRIREDGLNTIAHETGHFVDQLLGREIGDGYNLGITTLCRANFSKELSSQQKQFLNNFSNFLTSIEDVSDIGSTYKMSPNEVFARFVARFVEWTRNTATGNRYGYEADWYKDNFTQPQYVEFAKLLQEYSLLKTTNQVSDKVTRGNKNVYDQRIEDVYNELNKKKKQEVKVPIKQKVLKGNDGKTLKVYHGSPNANITEFDSNKAGSNTQSDFEGIYFTDNPSIAEDFSYEQLSGNSNLSYKRGNKGKVYENNLKYNNALNLNNLTEADIQNLEKYIDNDKLDGISKEQAVELMKKMAQNNNAQGVKFYLDFNALKNDYDLIIADMGGKYKGSNEYIVFNNNQIISNDNTATNKQEVKAPMKQENTQQTQEQNNNTKGETINWNEIERPEDNKKFRKHYRSIIESNQTTAEAKSIARDLMGTDTYTPETNKGQLAQADQRIMASSPETELQSLLSRAMNGEKISSVDIAVGERLIQYFSKTGNKQQLQEAIQATAMAGTSAGQTVQALSMLNHQTPQGQATWIQRSVDKMNKELAKRKGGTITTDVDGNLQVINKQGQDITSKVNLFNLTPEMIDKIMNSENQEQMYKNIDEVYEELGKQVPQSMLEKVDSWRYFSMLANARTHIRNMVGNVAMGKMQRVKDKIAGGIEGVVSQFNPNMERTKTLAIASKKTRDFVKQDFKNMEVQSRLELNENKYNPQSRLQNARRTFKHDALENTIGRLFNLNDKLLSAEDGLGLKAGYQKALADYITANKIDVDNITDAQLGKARNYAIQQAKEATFHQASAIASAITQFQNKNKATKFFVDALLPFKKTPINIAKAGMEYSPLQIAKSATLDVVNLRKGNISINQYIDNLAKGMTGTGIALVGYALANAGILKASGGDDKDKEKFDEEQGKQSYSIEIAGKTYSLDWLAPTGIPLFIGAETFKLYSQEDTEKSTEKSSEEDRLNQAIKGASNLLNAGATAINPMSEMSMISGLTSALSSYNTSDNLGSLGNMMTNMGKSYVNQFFPTLMGQVAKTGDEYERTTKSTAKGTIGKAVDQTINQIKAKVPGLRQTLPIKTDIWGKEVKQEVNLPLRAINNFVNPATVKQVSTDKVDMELNKLYEENHNSSILPDILTKTVQLNKQTYRLNNKEYAEFTKNYGQTSHKLIEDFIKTSDYNRLTQEQKETAISNIYSYAKEQNKMDYAKKVNEEVKPSTLYTTMKSIEKGGGKQSEYLNYLAKTKGMSKESEKNKVLANSSYSNKTKEIIYTNGTGKDDDLYNNLLSKSNINMTEYLNYKNEASDKAFSADKDKNGKTITGSGKKKVIAYLNNNITGSGNRLLIAGKSYALQNNEKQKLAQYINQIATTKEERLAIYNQLDKNFTVKDGKVYMKVSKK